MSDDDPGKLADELGQQAREMEQRSGKLSREIDDVGEDWERKRADPSVPGAPADIGGEESDETGAGAGQDAEKPPEGEGEREGLEDSEGQRSSDGESG